MYAHKTRAAFSAVFATAASLALIANVTPAFANGFSEPVSTAVSYRDLDLSSTSGVTRLHDRVRSAANRICGVRSQRDLKMRQIALDCRAQALASAASDIQIAIAEQTGKSRLASIDTARVIGVSKP